MRTFSSYAIQLQGASILIVVTAVIGLKRLCSFQSNLNPCFVCIVCVLKLLRPFTQFLKHWLSQFGSLECYFAISR